MKKNEANLTVESDIATEINKALGEEDPVVYWDWEVHAVIRRTHTKVEVYLRQQIVVAKQDGRRVTKSIARCRTAKGVAAAALDAANWV